ncbi:MAG: hypothetical protein AVDCRST_MAG18-3815, partial [uncultured Thermomicrobiales bacterium]
QRGVAHQPRGPRLAARPQSPGQGHRGRGAPHRLPPAGQAPVAQPPRAQVGPRQAPRRLARPHAHRPRNGGARMCRPGVRLRGPSRPPTTGHL